MVIAECFEIVEIEDAWVLAAEWVAWVVAQDDPKVSFGEQDISPAVALGEDQVALPVKRLFEPNLRFLRY